MIDFPALDHWLAEDEPLVGHPRDPFKRIDVLSGRRQVEVGLDDALAGATDNAVLLLET